MRTGLPATNLVTLMSALGLTRKQSSEMTASWNAWKDGEIARAQALARDALAARSAADEAHHLLFLTAFVTGDYHGALDHYRAIGVRYPRLAELTEPVIDASTG